MSAAVRPKGARPYFEAFLFGTTIGSFLAVGLRFGIPNAWWIAAAVGLVIALFLTYVWVPFIRLLLVGLLGIFVAAVASTSLFFGRVI